jgi:hypothetical protein
MKNSLAIVLLALIMVSCSTEDDLLFQEEAIEISKELPVDASRSLYIPPGATVTTVQVTFVGCVTYVLDVDVIKYGSAVVLAPDPSIFTNQGSSTIYFDIVPTPYGSTISVPVSSSNPYVYIDSAFLSGRTAFYWRMRVVNSGYNCWPNPTSWNYETL